MRQDGGLKEAKRCWVSGWLWDAHVRMERAGPGAAWLTSLKSRGPPVNELCENACRVAYTLDPGAWS